jgi:hypothetical protein
MLTLPRIIERRLNRLNQSDERLDVQLARTRSEPLGIALSAAVDSLLYNTNHSCQSAATALLGCAAT